jgi:hypothetical protein
MKNLADVIACMENNPPHAKPFSAAPPCSLVLVLATALLVTPP